MADTAFEAVTTRQAWYASVALAKYDAAQHAADGRFEKADGTRPFAGIVQYGTDKAGDMATVVRGTFPGVANAAVTAGAVVMTVAGKFAVATTGKTAVGIALTAAAAGELFAVSILETPFTVA